MDRLGIFWALLVLALLGTAALLWWRKHDPLPPLSRVEANTPALTAPVSGLAVYHLGHSLVGRDMPAMVEQLAQAAGFRHDHHSQLGWGTTLRQHWEPEHEIAGFDTENAHPRFRPALNAVQSGAYDAVVLTEMVELRDALRWHEGPRYFHLWAQAARAARPEVRLYLYETWHHLNDPAEWLSRLETDPAALWEGRLLAPAWADSALGPVHVIPAGRVMAALARRLHSEGPLPGLDAMTALFARNPDGTRDAIHLNDLGNYLVALTHFSVLYHRSAEGLPHELNRADGTPADAFPPETAAALQRLVWSVIQSLPVTGVAP